MIRFKFSKKKRSNHYIDKNQELSKAQKRILTRVLVMYFVLDFGLYLFEDLRIFRTQIFFHKSLDFLRSFECFNEISNS